MLHLNCTALSQSESNNFFIYIIKKENRIILRTVPTKYKDFCTRLGPRGKKIIATVIGIHRENLGGEGACFFRDN